LRKDNRVYMCAAV